MNYLKNIFFLLFLCNAYCHNPNEKSSEHLVLIKSCGRSGTYHMSSFLILNNILVGHEHFLKDGIVSWFFDDSLAPPFGPYLKNMKFKHVFHQVRNPLDVISSWYFNNISSKLEIKNQHSLVCKKTWDYIFKTIPEIDEKDSFITQLAKYWYYWNLKAEKGSEFRYKIEDLEEVFPIIFKRLGVKPENQALFIKKKLNSKVKYPRRLTWSQLKKVIPPKDFANLQSLAKKYGYPTKD